MFCLRTCFDVVWTGSSSSYISFLLACGFYVSLLSGLLRNDTIIDISWFERSHSFCVGWKRFLFPSHGYIRNMLFQFHNLQQPLFPVTGKLSQINTQTYTLPSIVSETVKKLKNRVENSTHMEVIRLQRVSKLNSWVSSCKLLNDALKDVPYFSLTMYISASVHTYPNMLQT
jgi:hypothetical protein